MSTHPTTHGVVVDFGEPPQRRTPASNELARKIIDDAREAYDRADRGGEFILPIPYQNHDVAARRQPAHPVQPAEQRALPVCQHLPVRVRSRLLPALVGYLEPRIL